MIALIKKDLHVYEVPIVGGAVLLVLTYLLTVSWMLGGASLMRSFSGVAMTAALSGGWMIVILAAVFGGAAFTIERRERSADFLALLPVARRRVVLSKVITAIACMLVLWIINGGVMLLAYQSNPNIAMGSPNTLGWARLAAAAAIMTFGLGWLLGTFLESPALATSISIAAMLSTLICTLTAVMRDDVPKALAQKQFLFAAETIFVCAGIACFAAGVVYYLRRVKP